MGVLLLGRKGKGSRGLIHSGSEGNVGGNHDGDLSCNNPHTDRWGEMQGRDSVRKGGIEEIKRRGEGKQVLSVRWEGRKQTPRSACIIFTFCFLFQ